MMTKPRNFRNPAWQRVKKLTARAQGATGCFAGVDRPRTTNSCSGRCSMFFALAFDGKIWQRPSVRGPRSIRTTCAVEPRDCLPACSRSSRREPKENCAISSTVRLLSYTRTGRITVADRPLTRTAEPQEGSTLSWRQSSSAVSGPSHSTWLRANATTFSPSNHCWPACGGDVSSVKRLRRQQFSSATASPRHPFL
jgi:hypothetical protein